MCVNKKGTKKTSTSRVQRFRETERRRGRQFRCAGLSRVRNHDEGIRKTLRATASLMSNEKGRSRRREREGNFEKVRLGSMPACTSLYTGARYVLRFVTR